MNFKWILLTWCFLGSGLGILYSQPPNVHINKKGVMMWTDSGAEVQGFGVNYTVPFAHAYRSAEKLGVDPKEAIDQDIYHFARLGFDAYRVHVWDTQISDTLGNLLDNSHLDLFDYMVSEMQKRGMNMLITPIAFWGNGWPERDTWTPGFAYKYGKAGCLTNEEAIEAQANYLAQFLNHVNPYTGKAYKEDPHVIAFEVSNEPHHHTQSPDSVTRYVKKMVSAMKSTGYSKPILYNISHGVHLMDAYFKGGVNGGTFQWYPTGLGAGEELNGNFLPNVDRYDIPFSENQSFKQGAKVVYEFDAADVGRSYIYPAMARSFRTAGIQWATHFAYDPTFLAYANTEYNTHYMNLVYTPQKALSLKIAGEVFRKVPLYKNYGNYPENTRFDDFRVSYKDDLAIYNADEKYFYTNRHNDLPKNQKKLKEIAGYGNSRMVQYDGQGAYFLDQLDKGVWRLEVMPDAIWVADPFGKNSLNRTLAEVVWQTRKMKINLSDLGESFSLNPINEGNTWTPQVYAASFDVRPGTYLVVKNGIKSNWKGSESWKNIQLNEFTAPKSTLEKTYVMHEPIPSITAGVDYEVKVDVVNLGILENLKVIAYNGRKPVEIAMKKKNGFTYTATIPGAQIKAGTLKYYIIVNGITHPDGVEGLPGDWDFAATPYAVNVLSIGSAIELYNAIMDDEEVSRNWAPGSKLIPLSQFGEGELQLNINSLFEVDSENPNAEPIYDYSIRYCFKEKLKGRKGDLAKAETLVFKGRSLTKQPSYIQVALVTKEGMAYGKEIEIDTEVREYSIPLDELLPVNLVNMPRPYPTFLPYYFQRASVEPFDLSTIETLQISMGPGMSDADKIKPQKVGIRAVWVE